MSQTPGASESSHTWFDIRPGDHLSPVLLHVPHASRVIPAWVRAGIVLDDDDLARELDAMTDAHTDLIAAAVCSRAERSPWQFVNRTSRLVVDPERFPDEREEMAAVGMAAVYAATSTGDRLRVPDVSRDQGLLAEFFAPYSDALADLVDERLAATGGAILLDVHSYPLHPHPYELHQVDARPEVCLGVDQTHTPEWLVAAARLALAAISSVRINEPFRGTYVPLRHYQSDQRVSSLMLEIRRDVYTRPDGSPDPGRIETLAAAIAKIVDECGVRAGRESPAPPIQPVEAPMTSTEQHPDTPRPAPPRLTDADVRTARAMATAAHLGQLDKAGVAYIEHPERVVGHLVNPTNEQAAVAWLHDVVEDTPTILEDVEAAFGSLVAAAVDAMTRRPGEPKLDYYARVKANSLALTVKTADLADNTDPVRLAALPPELRARLEAKYAVARSYLGLL